MIYQQIGRDDLSCPYVLNLLDQERESIESGGWTDGRTDLATATCSCLGTVTKQFNEGKKIDIMIIFSCH